jgi:hypothetical protein
MSDAWGPSASPPQQPGSGAFRDVLVIAVLAVAGVAGLVIWSGGDVSESTELEPSASSLPSQGSVAAPAVTAMVAAQDALIGVLPVPAGGTEQPATTAGVRSWTFAGTDWQSIRDTYVATLQQQGFTVELRAPVNDGATVGEVYTLTDPSRTISVQLTVGTSAGQSAIGVTRS